MTGAAARGGWRIGIDTGGTFTDLVAVSPQGEVRLRKVNSTPDRPSDAVFSALARTELDLSAELDHFVLGTTIATNAVIQRSGARTIFLTTAGFEDILQIQRIDRRGLYDLQWVKPAPYAARHHTFGVTERVLADGSILTALTDAEIDRIVGLLRKELATEPDSAVAVSLLFSYENPVHEQMLKAAIHESLPGLSVSVSSDVAPIWREYERSNTTVVDAFVKPIVTSFCESLQSGLTEKTASGWHSLMKSNGGQVPLDRARYRPAELVLSGLAGGMIAGNYWARTLGASKAVTLDMGGTSADVGVVVDGQLMFSGLFEIEWGLPLCLPIIDVTTIGAGGSSVAAIDRTGLLRVGPESAGANPGPSCYGLGGTSPTVTDANLVIGRLDPGYFLGGELRLDMDKAREAVRSIADPLGVDLADAAEAILSVSIENMAGAVRLVTVDRGHDYRDFDLVAFGGAGPLHAVELARRLGMRRVVVPPSPGLVSAFGAVIADERVDRRVTLVRRLDRPEASDVPAELQRLVQAAADELAAQRRHDDQPMVATTHVACRYLGQNYEQEVRMYHGHVDKTFELAITVNPADPDFVDQLAARFHQKHEQAYGYSLLDQPIQSVYLGATVVVPASQIAALAYRKAELSVRREAHRPVLVGRGEWAEAAVANRADLQPGDVVNGPAIIEEPDSTTYVPGGFQAEVHATYCLVVTADASSGRIQ